MSTGFPPHNMLECESPKELPRFAEEKLYAAWGPPLAAWVAEIRALLKLIPGCFPAS